MTSNKHLKFASNYEAMGWIKAFCQKHRYRVQWRTPLSLNIYKQLRAIISPKVMSSRQLYNAINFHQQSIKYLRGIIEGRPRYNISGLEDGVVTKEEEQQAREHLAKLHAGYLRDKRKQRHKVYTAPPKEPKPSSGTGRTLSLKK